MSRIIGIMVAVAVALTVVAGCSSVLGVGVDEKADSGAISAQVPDELKSFPVPSGFKMGEGGTVTQDGDLKAMASWRGKSTVDKVAQFYKDAMPGRGWKESEASTSDDGGVLAYAKDPESLTITLGKSGDEVDLSVVLTKASKK